MALSVPLGRTGDTQVPLIQEAYTGSDRQLWRITEAQKGQFKISAKSAELQNGNLAMSAGHGYSEDSNAILVEQCQYTQDGNYNDEWFICSTVEIGISTDDYTGSSIHDELGAYYYATKFCENLVYPMDTGPFSITHHYNSGSIHTASKRDFSNAGAMSYTTDFMIYMGHGFAARNRDDGNYIHYNYTETGEAHTSDCTNDVYNVYSKKVKFGSDISDLRWVLMYTCNFLHAKEDNNDDDNNDTNDNDFIENADLVGMMNDAHMVMGYASRAEVNRSMVNVFATYLREGKPIYEAFLLAGYEGETTSAEANHYQKILYIPQARYETIYSPAVHYDYDETDVEIYKKNIFDNCVFD